MNAGDFTAAIDRTVERSMASDVDKYHAPMTANEEYLESKLSRYEDAFDRISEAAEATQSAWEELEAARDHLFKLPPFTARDDWDEASRMLSVNQGMFEAQYLDLKDKVREMEAIR